jgi:NAD(P)-dependent dehydrogenase (short-subunit alcohol dehydrogenase family)
MSDSITVVTGAASGIGLATARLLASSRSVLAADRDEEALAAAFADSPEVARAPVDVASETSVEALFAAAAERGRLTGLVNVAGIGSTTTAPETSLETWERVMAVNATGVFLCCKQAIPLIAAAGGGSVVNMSSIAALVGLRSRAAYCASKGAVLSLTRALAVDHVGEGIRVNAVCPGTVDSPWVRRLVEEQGESLDALRARQPMGRLGATGEIAAAVAYLLDSEFSTGSVLTIDGGLTAA